MKILITGGTGFIAKNITEQIGDEFQVVAHNIETLNLLDSGQVAEYIKQNRFEVVIHTANYDAATKYSSNDPAKVLDYNLRMFFNLVRCRDHYGKLLYFGSGAEYDRQHWAPRMAESYFDRHVPSDQYGYSKYLMTQYSLQTSNIYNLRLFAVFGKYEDWRIRFISNACCCAVLGLPIKIKQNVRYDYLYIDDLVKIVKWFVSNQPQKSVYNICTGRAYDLKTLADMVIKASGKELDIDILKDGLGVEYSGDNSLLTQEIGPIEFSEIGGAIKTLYEWYEANKQIIGKGELL